MALLSAAERRRVVEEWNATDAAFPAGACVHELFQAQVERTPGAVAVSFEGRPLTYAELNARANRLAHHLRALGVGPEVRVAVCVKRGPEMVVALLAVLKAGGAYVPLDPGLAGGPSRATCWTTRARRAADVAAVAARFAGAGVPVVDLDAAAAWDATGVGRPAAPRGCGPEHLAYVIYTSGSTGQPKGVRCGTAAGQPAARHAAAFGVGPGDRVLPALVARLRHLPLGASGPLVAGGRSACSSPRREHRARRVLGGRGRADGVTTLTA